MNWIKEIEYQKFLSGDLKILADILGIEKVMELYKVFTKTTIYFSEKPLMEMKQEYIRKYIGFKSEKEIARELGVSERLVYKIGSQKISSGNQLELFKKEE